MSKPSTLDGAVEARHSGIHGSGLFALRDIPEETYIIEYIGEKITKAESNRRGIAQMELAEKTGGAAVYIFDLNKRYDLDGDVPGNIAKYVNHSCEPNCEAYNVRGRIWFASTRPIAEGEELTYDYGYALEHYEDHPCRCGTPDCIGYIVNREDRPKLRRLLDRKRNPSKSLLKKGKKKKTSKSGKKSKNGKKS